HTRCERQQRRGDSRSEHESFPMPERVILIDTSFFDQVERGNPGRHLEAGGQETRPFRLTRCDVANVYLPGVRRGDRRARGAGTESLLPQANRLVSGSEQAPAPTAAAGRQRAASARGRIARRGPGVEDASLPVLAPAAGDVEGVSVPPPDEQEWSRS